MVNADKIINEKFKLALTGIGNDFNNALVKACPVDTGALKQSITYSVEGEKIKVSMLYYGYIVDALGNAKHVPNPWLTRTLNVELKPIVIENIKRQFR